MSELEQQEKVTEEPQIEKSEDNVNKKGRKKSGVVKTTLWNKVLKKNICKSVPLKNFQGTEEEQRKQAKEFLAKWRDDERAKMKIELEILEKRGEIPNEKRGRPKIKETKHTITQEFDNEILKDESQITEKVRYDKRLYLDIEDRNGVGWTCAIIAGSKSGKTSLMKAIYDKYFKKEKDYLTILISPNLHAPIYKSIDKLQRVVSSKYFLPDLVNATFKVNQMTGNRYKYLYVLDDLANTIKNDRTLNNMVSIMRNGNISHINLVQTPTMLSRSNSSQMNCLIFGKFRSLPMVQEILEKWLNPYFPHTMNMKDKINLYNKITSNYRWIVLDTLSDEISFLSLPK